MQKENTQKVFNFLMKHFQESVFISALEVIRLDIKVSDYELQSFLSDNEIRAAYNDFFKKYATYTLVRCDLEENIIIFEIPEEIFYELHSQYSGYVKT